jgi:preprotein translocase subunit SecG
MRNRLLATLIPVVLLASLALAPAASAYNDGRGFYGATNDRVVTNAGFILVIFFPTFIFVASMIQRRLEKRKDARKAAQKALSSNGHLRGGW